MKKLILLFGLFAFVATASFAQTEKDTKKEKAAVEKTTPSQKNVVAGGSDTKSCAGAEKGACCSKDKGTASAGKGKEGAACCSKDKGTASAGKGKDGAACSGEKSKDGSCCSKDAKKGEKAAPAKAEKAAPTKK